ncbi:MAG: DUF6580 family putative transport protein [Chitinophagaceae bacterium]|jgi:hypothetical protein
MKNNQLFLAIGLVLLAVVSRIMCAEIGAYNFAPVVAIGLVSGMLVKDVKTAILIALLGQFLADVYFQVFPTLTNTGFYGMAQFFVYAGLIVAAFIGKAMNKVNAGTIVGGTLAASVSFFIISNFGYFAQGYNGYTFSGLTTTYVDAIPFFKSSLLADFVGSAVLFSAYFATKFAFPKPIKAA